MGDEVVPIIVAMIVLGTVKVKAITATMMNDPLRKTEYSLTPDTRIIIMLSRSMNFFRVWY